MPQRTAKVEQVYADRQIKAGEVFDVEQHHIELLSLLGRIEPEEDKPSMTYGTRAMVAQSPRAKRAYNRKAA